MKKWHADEIGSGIEHDYGVDVYLASEVDAHIANTIATYTLRQAELEYRVAELEKGLREIADTKSFHTIHEMRAIAAKALGL